MPSFRTGVVTQILDARPGLQRALVDLGRGGERACVLTQLVGPVDAGDRVVVNTSAVELGLGTGGWHIVHWNLSREQWAGPGPARGDDTVMKLRYTSVQVDHEADVVTTEAPTAEFLRGMPVVVGTVHSQLAAIAVAFKHCRPDLRLAYVMTDGGALPIAISDLVWELRTRGLLDATVTCGHAFGGDHEAVSVASALVTARTRAQADAVVVAMGPGGVGTASRLGFSGLEAAAALDHAGALGALPILAVRASAADPRRRHLGVSHHSTTVLEMARSSVQVPLPRAQAAIGVDFGHTLPTVARARSHHVVDVPVPDVTELFAAHKLEVESMGRSVAEDPLFFAAAAAAGILAATAVQ